MAYFDHLVENPEDALNEAAKRRGLSREAMSTRLEAIRSAGSGNGHISLIQAQSYFDEDAAPPEDLVTHVRQCAYCTELLNGLEAAAVEESLEIALAKVKALGAGPISRVVDLDGTAVLEVGDDTMIETPGITVRTSKSQVEFGSAAVAEVPDVVDSQEDDALDRSSEAMQAMLTPQTAVKEAPAVHNSRRWEVVDVNEGTVTLRRPKKEYSSSLMRGERVVVVSRSTLKDQETVTGDALHYGVTK